MTILTMTKLFLHTFDMVYAEDYQEFIDNPSSLYSLKKNMKIYYPYLKMD